MDKYVFLMLLLAPGFIASTTAVFCGNQPNKQSEFGFVMRYFSYSFFSLLVILLLSLAFGIVEIGETWQSVADKMCNVRTTMAMLIITIVSSVMVGVVWSLFLRYKYLELFNYLKGTKLLYGTVTYVDNTTLEHLFLDNRNHFVTIEQDGKEISIGFIDCIGSTDAEHQELSVDEHPGYREWMERQRAKGRGMMYCKKTYIDVNNRLIIREFNYPEEWSHYED